MVTYEVEILEPKAAAILDEMAGDKLIKILKGSNGNGDGKRPLKRGSMKGLILYMAEDFDAPLEDFKTICNAHPDRYQCSHLAS